MYIVVFDTETTSVEKPFVYDIGYLVYDTENDCVVIHRSYIVKQTWENRMLFSTAYYADKKEFYRQKMKAKAITKKPIAEIVAQMITDFEYYEIAYAYAFNSTFDEKEIEEKILPKMEKLAKDPFDYYLQTTRAFVLMRKGEDKRREARDAFAAAFQLQSVLLKLFSGLEDFHFNVSTPPSSCVCPDVRHTGYRSSHRKVF